MNRSSDCDDDWIYGATGHEYYNVLCDSFCRRREINDCENYNCPFYYSSSNIIKSNEELSVF